MRIHIGSRKTLLTRCGKSVKRRWWVERRRIEHGRIANLTVYREIDGRKIASCRDCLHPKRRAA